MIEREKQIGHRLATLERAQPAGCDAAHTGVRIGERFAERTDRGWASGLDQRGKRLAAKLGAPVMQVRLN